MENENQTGTVLQEETRIPAAAEQSVPVDALPETNVEEASQTAEEQQEKETACCCCECEAEQAEQKAAPAPAIPVTADMVEKCKTVLGTMLDYLGLDGTVKAEGKTIIASGDVRSTDDLAPFLEEGCDLLLMETGHHSAPKLCQEWKERNYAIGKVVFFHHGREILRDEAGVAARCAEIRGEAVTMAFDGMELEL